MHPWLRIGRAFSPWAVALSVPRALPWAGIRARRWRLRPSAGCGFLGSVTTSAFPQTDPLPNFVHPCFRFFRGAEEDDSVVPPIRLRSGLHSGLRQSGSASSRRVVYGTAEAVPLSKTGVFAACECVPLR